LQLQPFNRPEKLHQQSQQQQLHQQQSQSFVPQATPRKSLKLLPLRSQRLLDSPAPQQQG
jgi:hypothetical protein